MQTMTKFDQSVLEERWAKRQLMQDWLQTFHRPYSHDVRTHHFTSSKDTAVTGGDPRSFQSPSIRKRHQLIGVDVAMEPKRKVRCHLPSVNAMLSHQRHARQSDVVPNGASRYEDYRHDPTRTASFSSSQVTYNPELKHCGMSCRAIETIHPSTLSYKSCDEEKITAHPSAPAGCSLSPVWRPKSESSAFKMGVAKPSSQNTLRSNLPGSQASQTKSIASSVYTSNACQVDPFKNRTTSPFSVHSQLSSVRERLKQRTAQVTAASQLAKAAAAPSTVSSVKPIRARPKKTSRYLRERDRREILAQISLGQKQSVLAAKYNVSRAAICNLVKHREEILGRMHENPNAKHPKKPRNSVLSSQEVVLKTSDSRNVMEGASGKDFQMANYLQSGVRSPYPSSGTVL